jgi:Tfp pilus assembly PilM family ATPase
MIKKIVYNMKKKINEKELKGIVSNVIREYMSNDEKVREYDRASEIQEAKAELGAKIKELIDNSHFLC